MSNREKIIFSFLLILIVVNVLTLVITYSLGSFSSSFQSILNDRLVPASDISKIQELYYKNRLKVEELIFQVDPADHNQIAQISVNNQKISQILKKYMLTHLTEDEAFKLDKLKSEMKNYRALELLILKEYTAGNTKKAQELFLTNSLSEFNDMLNLLHNLAEIQLVVGEKLYHEALNSVSVIKVTTYMSIAVAILLTLNMLKVLDIKMNR